MKHTRYMAGKLTAFQRVKRYCASEEKRLKTVRATKAQFAGGRYANSADATSLTRITLR